MLALIFLGIFASAFGSDFSCNFDNDNLCGLVQSSSDNFDWTLMRYATPSYSTGPSGDHSGSGHGYYLYMEASGRSYGDIARIETPQAYSFDSGNKCVKFMYHMYGADMGYLDVYVGGKWVWYEGGYNLGNTWNSASIKISAMHGTHKVAFEAWRGNGYMSDIAIDSIVIEDCSGTLPTTQAPPPPGTTQAPTPPPPTQGPTPPPPTQSPPTPGSCGIRPTTRIVGGADANHGDWPWQALLLSASSGSQFCGGALVTPEWVVTASHCVSGLSPSNVKIRMGAHKRTSPDPSTEQVFKVTQIVMHNSYQNPMTYSNDIALLKLERPAILNKYTNLVCLPQHNNHVPAGSKCWITGWGTLSSGGSQPENLQQAEVPIVHADICKTSYPGEIDDSMICAGLKQGGVDACQGDSGGPMVCESNGVFYLHGATSWGYGCAAPDKYGVYARVAHLRQWIDHQINAN